MTRTQADHQAACESGMHRQGGQWVVRTWDSGFGCEREHAPQHFFTARVHLREWRDRRAAELLGEGS